MTKTIFALVTAGILGAAMIPSAVNAAPATDTTAGMTKDTTADATKDTTTSGVTKNDVRKDKMAVHQERRMLRHSVRAGDFDRAQRLRRNIRMDRNDLRRDRILRHETLR